MADDRRDFIVFHSARELSPRDVEVVRGQFESVFDDMKVIFCGPGDSVSMPMDVRMLCESVLSLRDCVAQLVQVNQELLMSNQEMLAEIIEMHQEAEDVTNPEHHLGLAGLG